MPRPWCGLALTIGVLGAVGASIAAWAQTQSTTYDALGRVASVITTDGKQTIYSYDAAGNRTTAAVNATATTPPTASDQAISYTFGNPPPAPIDPPLSTYVTIVGVTPAELGTTSFTSTTLTYVPGATAVAGTDHFGYEVRDSRTGLTASALVTVTLSAP
jgi:YD repeat-containing protein